MKKRPSINQGHWPKIGTAGLTFAISVITSTSVQALDLNWLDGKMTGTFDSTISYGATWRTESRDPWLAATGPYAELEGPSNTGRNDGNNNFGVGLVSSTAKITSELDLFFRDNMGVFARASAFYDERIMDGTHDGGFNYQYDNLYNGNRFPGVIKDQAGSDARILDAYIWADFDINEMPLNIRFGEQVISWGEALFFQGGINQANPANLAALRLPGAEIKEALLPLPMFYMQLGVTESITLEGFYQFDWENSEGDPVGTFLSTSDSFIGKGADNVIIDLSTTPAGQAVGIYNSVKGITDEYRLDQMVLYRGKTIEPDKDGQFGIALRWYAEQLNNTEFGFYYMNYHSRIQVAGGKTGEAFGAGIEGSNACNATIALIATQLGDAASLLNCGDLLDIQYGLPLRSELGGVTFEELAAAAGITDAAAAAAGVSQAIGAFNYFHLLDTTDYFYIFPEDVELFGLSFNTTVGGISLAGELAYRPEAPMLPETGDNIIAYSALAGINVANNDNDDSNCPDSANATQQRGFYGPHLGCLTSGESFIAMEEKETYNLSLLAINSLGKVAGADNLVGILELGAAYVAGVDSYDPTDPYSKLYAATDAYAYIPTLGVTDGDSSQYMTPLSWGYRLALSADYNNVFAGINLSPTLRFSHDVEGNSPIGGNFMEGRKSATVGTTATYLFNLKFGFNYTWFWGAEDHNMLQDRDHVSANVSYSF